jgi:NAD+ synthase
MIKNYSDLQNKMKINHEKILSGISNNIINHMHKLEKDGILIGLSGGLDSTVVTAICTKALGYDKVKVLLLPDRESSKNNLRDALDFAKQLKIKWEIIDITTLLRDFNIRKYGFFSRVTPIDIIKGLLYKKAYQYYKKISDETPFASQLKGVGKKPYHHYIQKGQAILNAKHRLRMVLQYYYAERENRMVVGCTNKTEQQIGFFVKYGCDHLADLMPIIGLYKTQIYQLAKYLEIPDRIIQKEPTPDLLPGLNDKIMIGIPYEQIDLVLLASENNLSPEDINKMTGIKVDTVNSIIDLVHYAKDIVGVT